MPDKPIAIIDIGSNSVRLVVYSARRPGPLPDLQRKNPCRARVEPGRDRRDHRPQPTTGAPGAAPVQIAHRSHGRRQPPMSSRPPLPATPATARSWSPTSARSGLPCRVLRADEEATLAGLGVVSGIPRCRRDRRRPWRRQPGAGRHRRRQGNKRRCRCRSASFGSTPKAKVRASSFAESVRDSGLAKAAAGRTLYLVGGSWRSLARIDMIATDYPLPIIHQYSMAPERAAELRMIVDGRPALVGRDRPGAARVLARCGDAACDAGRGASARRGWSSPPSGFAKACSIPQLQADQRALDPLTAAAREISNADRRVETSATVSTPGSPARSTIPGMLAIRLAACLLAHLAWQANPEFRADRAVEQALHANWVGIDGGGRVMMAQALSSAFGRDKLPDPRLRDSAARAELLRAKPMGAGDPRRAATVRRDPLGARRAAGSRTRAHAGAEVSRAARATWSMTA